MLPNSLAWPSFCMFVCLQQFRAIQPFSTIFLFDRSFFDQQIGMLLVCQDAPGGVRGAPAHAGPGPLGTTSGARKRWLGVSGALAGWLAGWLAEPARWLVFCCCCCNGYSSIWYQGLRITYELSGSLAKLFPTPLNKSAFLDYRASSSIGCGC